MQLTMRRPVPSRAFLYLALVGVLIAALVAVVVLQAGTTPIPASLRATNGLIAVDTASKLYVADPDGSNPRPLAQFGTNANSPMFSPDGSKVAYLSTNDVGQLHVFVANADGSDPVRVSAEPFDSGRNKFPPKWSPDGTQLVHYARDNGIWVMAADGSSQQRIAEGWSVAWSPDGQWIAFRSDGSPEALLRVIHPDGSGIRTLATADPNSDAFASLGWTADSARVVFHRPAQGVASVDLDAVEVPLASGGLYPTVSPDGRYVAFTEEAEEGELVKLVELATGRISTLGPGGCAANWAPDSSAVVTYADGCFQHLQIIPLDDPSAAVVIDLPTGTVGFPAWQPIPAPAAED